MAQIPNSSDWEAMEEAQLQQALAESLQTLELDKQRRERWAYDFARPASPKINHTATLEPPKSNSARTSPIDSSIMRPRPTVSNEAPKIPPRPSLRDSSKSTEIPALPPVPSIPRRSAQASSSLNFENLSSNSQIADSSTSSDLINLASPTNMSKIQSRKNSEFVSMEYFDPIKTAKPVTLGRTESCKPTFFSIGENKASVPSNQTPLSKIEVPARVSPKVSQWPENRTSGPIKVEHNAVQVQNTAQSIQTPDNSVFCSDYVSMRWKRDEFQKLTGFDSKNSSKPTSPEVDLMDLGIRYDQSNMEFNSLQAFDPLYSESAPYDDSMFDDRPESNLYFGSDVSLDKIALDPFPELTCTKAGAFLPAMSSFGHRNDISKQNKVNQKLKTSEDTRQSNSVSRHESITQIDPFTAVENQASAWHSNAAKGSVKPPEVRAEKAADVNIDLMRNRNSNSTLINVPSSAVLENAAGDSEARSFYEMVRGIYEEGRKRCFTSSAYLISSPKCRHSIKSMTVKITVFARFFIEPFIFTPDVTDTIEDAIRFILSNIAYDIGSTSTDDYLMKVHGLSEYFENKHQLAEYIYIQDCLKLDKDICLDLIDLPTANKDLLRTIGESNYFAMEPWPLENKGKVQIVEKEKLKITIETFYTEVQRLKDSLKKGASPKCNGLEQSVKFVCFILGGLKTIGVIEALYSLRKAAENFNSAPSPLTSRESFVYNRAEEYNSEAVTTGKLDAFESTLTMLVESVEEMVNVYCSTFATDFRLLSSTESLNIGKKPVNECNDIFILNIFSCHPIRDQWFERFKEFRVRCGIYYSGKQIFDVKDTAAATHLTDTQHHQNSISWNEWIIFDKVILSRIQREARLCFTLYGIRVETTGNSTIEAPSALGWVSLQLFNHKGELISGSHLLALWPYNKANSNGTNMSQPAQDSVYLQLNFPKFTYNYIFPEVQTNDIPFRNEDINNLTSEEQTLAKRIMLKNPIEGLDVNEQRLMWEGREYLHRFPEALAKVLKSCPEWSYRSLGHIYKMLESWKRPSELQALELLLPWFADTTVRSMAVKWISSWNNDELCGYLPQLVQALKFECYHNSALAHLLLHRAEGDLRFAHQLYWLLKDAAEDDFYRKRYGLMIQGLLSLVGKRMCEELLNELLLTQKITHAAKLVKSARKENKNDVLSKELENANNLFVDETHRVPDYASERYKVCRLPIAPGFETVGIDTQSSSFFTSAALPLKLVFKSVDQTMQSLNVMFKDGDDLRQDIIVIQLFGLMDQLWRDCNLDLKMITFLCLSTGLKQGFVKLVTECETLRDIQTFGHGSAGSFRAEGILEWLQKHNTSQLHYFKAIDNFIRSCAGCCVATYILGTCDRHNDNIMIKHSGHMFHIDFGKIFGDAQKFFGISRDRVPFVLTSDMVYVLEMGMPQNRGFQLFVEYSCEAFNILRQNANLFITLLSLMSSSGVPALNGKTAVEYVRDTLVLHMNDTQARAYFTELIMKSKESKSSQVNFWFHNLAQAKYHKPSDIPKLSFAPKMSSLQADGRIVNVEILDYQKRYDSGDKHYVYIIEVKREKEKLPTLIYRRYEYFQELRKILMQIFPQISFQPLPEKRQFLRSAIQQVASERLQYIIVFLQHLMTCAPEVTDHDIVYTFFHPTLGDEKTAFVPVRKPDPSNLVPEEEVTRSANGQIELEMLFNNGRLTVFVKYARDLPCPKGELPYICIKIADEIKKCRARDAKPTASPTFNQNVEFSMPANNLLGKDVYITVCSKKDEVLAFLNIPARECPAKWYPLKPTNASKLQF